MHPTIKHFKILSLEGVVSTLTELRVQTRVQERPSWRAPGRAYLKRHSA